jgi:hypothetical protein
MFKGGKGSMDVPHVTATCIDCWNEVSRGSSVSIVSDYEMDDPVVGVRSPADAKGFSCSPCVQTSSKAHPASCPMGTAGPFPGGKARSGRDADHSPPPSTGVKNEHELYVLSTQALPWRVAGQLYFYLHEVHDLHERCR